MNRKLLFVLPLSWLLVGCAERTSKLVCEEYSGPDVPCNPAQDPQVPHVTLNTTSLRVNPSCVRANRGTTLVFNLRPRNDNTLGSAKIFPKDDAGNAGNWLKGSNDMDKDEILILVPKDLKLGIRYYNFKVGDKCIDPRVSVE